MLVAELQQMVEEVAGVDPACRDQDLLTSGLAATGRLQAWLDGRKIALAAQLTEVAADAAPVVAEVTRTSRREARACWIGRRRSTRCRRWAWP